jgi:hypothetical protein
MSATTIFRKIAHPTVRQPRFVFDALHVAEFDFYFRLAWLGERFSFNSYASWWLSLPFTLRGIERQR